MAAKKKAKAKKKSPAKKKAKKAVKKVKAVAKKAKRVAKKKTKKAKKKAPGMLARAIKAVKKAVTPAKKKKKKQAIGEGDYAASRKYDADQASFVKKNKAQIPELAKEAEKALDGPEGDSLRAAEAEGLAHSRDTFGA